MNTLFKTGAAAALTLLFAAEVAAQEGLTVTPAAYRTEQPKRVEIIRNGDRVEVAFDTALPEGFIGRSEAFVFAPRFVNGAWSLTLPAVSVEGSYYARVTQGKEFFREKRYADTVVYAEHVRYRGDSLRIHYQTAVDYAPEMDGARMELACEYRTDCYRKDDRNRHGSVAPLEGPTERLAMPAPEPESEPEIVSEPQPEPVVEQPAAPAVLTQDFGGTLLFGLSSTRPEETALAAFCERIDRLAAQEGTTVTAVRVFAASSPEGAYAVNEQLAKSRAESVARYLAEHVDIPADVVTTSWEAENWEGFFAALPAAKLSDEAAVRDIAARFDQADAREQELAKLPGYRTQILPLFRKLRCCRITVEYTGPGEETAAITE